MKRLLSPVVLALLLWPGTSPALDLPVEGLMKKAGVEQVTTASGLIYFDTKVGDGIEARPGLSVTVHYTGRLLDGTVFDRSKEGKPFVFTIGEGRVIKGWEEGISGMKVGGARLLIIPPHLAYGDRRVGDRIPPGATLTFDVQLMDVTDVVDERKKTEFGWGDEGMSIGTDGKLPSQ